MSSFNDRNGRTWTPRITCGVLKRYERATKLSVFRLFAQHGAAALGHVVPGIDELIKLIHLAIAYQNPLVSEDDLADAIGGDSLQAAWDAVLEELGDFFPPTKKVLGLLKSDGLTRGSERIASLNEQAIAQADQELRATPSAPPSPGTT